MVPKDASRWRGETMLLRVSDWEQIRTKFTDIEKKLLNESISGETICPRGFIIDESKASDLIIKIRSLLKKGVHNATK